MKYFSIPAPCSENWNEMTSTEKGAFCQKCSNEVHDVSKMSNGEIIQLIASEKKIPCMRMTPSQERTLNMDFKLMHQSQKRNMQRAMLFSLLVVFGFTLFSCNNAQQIHERNLLESAAVQLVEMADNAQSEAQKAIELKESENESHELEVKQLERVEDIESIHQELLVLGEPAMSLEIVYEECVIDEKRVEIAEEYHTMGVPIMYERLELPTVIEVEAVQISKEGSNLPEVFSALTFPNPATTSTTLKVELPNQTESLGIRLLDMNGRVLQNINDKAADAGVHEFRIDLMDLKPAYYLIDVRYNDQHEVVRLSKAQ